MQTMSTWWMWAGFLAFIFIMIIIDLYVLGGKKAHRISNREALAWSILWFTLALLFGWLLWWYLKINDPIVANEKALQFLTGYLLEKSLSIDNIFVFVMIFNFFAVPKEYQHRVLIYGVIGALVMRAIMILFGVWLIGKFAWILYFFGAFLIFTGIKMFVFAEHQPDLNKNALLLFVKKHLRITNDYHGQRFFVTLNKISYATPLLLALVMIEISDLIFAVDSIPAVFSVTQDPFIVFTSNIFAILGLRALYFLLANLAERFHLLKYAIAIILTFVGFKMLIVHWIKIPTTYTLLVIGLTIFISIVLSYRGRLG